MGELGRAFDTIQSNIHTIHISLMQILVDRDAVFMLQCGERLLSLPLCLFHEHRWLGPKGLHLLHIKDRVAGDALWQGLAKDAQADGTDEPDVDDAFMAKTGGPEIDVGGGGQVQVLACLLVGQEEHHEVSEHTLPRRNVFVNPPRRVARLLQENGVPVPADSTNVDGHLLTLGGEDAVHHGNVLECQVATH